MGTGNIGLVFSYVLLVSIGSGGWVIRARETRKEMGGQRRDALAGTVALRRVGASGESRRKTITSRRR